MYPLLIPSGLLQNGKSGPLRFTQGINSLKACSDPIQILGRERLAHERIDLLVVKPTQDAVFSP